MNIRPSDIVLEIGSGDNPHPRADVLVDKYMQGDSERGGQIIIDRSLVVADLENLPFRDHAFDYIICRHVVEHLENPEKGIKEMMRVAKRGYIESPSLAGEIIFGWSFHRWVLSVENGKLIFTPKKWSNPLGGLFHDLLKTDFIFKLFFKRHRARFYTVLEWENEISFEIKTDSFVDFQEEMDSSYKLRQKYEKNHKTSTDIIRKKEEIKRVIKKTTSAKHKIKKSLNEILMCPICRNIVLDANGNQCICKQCGYKIEAYQI
ncbi:methyltransferase domain-containing protein [bacterium]|nr:methyltransferase domain-containing protein [bacterium]